MRTLSSMHLTPFSTHSNFIVCTLPYRSLDARYISPKPCAVRKSRAIDSSSDDSMSPATLRSELSDRTLPSASTHTLPPLNAKHTVPFSALYSASSLSSSRPKNSAAIALASLCAMGFLPVLCAVFAYFPS